MSEDLLTEPDAGATAVGIWLTGAGIGLHNYFFFYEFVYLFICFYSQSVGFLFERAGTRSGARS